jgi:hypothetical protein
MQNRAGCWTNGSLLAKPKLAAALSRRDRIKHSAGTAIWAIRRANCTVETKPVGYNLNTGQQDPFRPIQIS